MSNHVSLEGKQEQVIDTIENKNNSFFSVKDEHIAREKNMFNITGGCAAIVVLVMMDRVYVAHAGDCR